MSNRNTKRLLVGASLLSLVVVLAACGTSTVTENSTGFWDRQIIYNAAQFIIWLSNLLGGNPGMGIIAFTLIVRVLIFPLSYIGIKNMGKQQEIAPEMKALQKKYSSKDAETQRLLQQETQKLYAKEGINPMMGCLPLLVQMPFMIALYQAIYRTEALKVGKFLWFNLGSPDHTWILPILAALFTLLSTLTSTMSQPTQNAMTWSMAVISPLMILFMGAKFPSALALYWVVTNAFQLGQTFLLQNPFKIKREREAKEQAKRDKEKAKRKAYKKALRKK